MSLPSTTPQPQLARLSLPNSSDEYFVHIISNLLSASECDQIIASHTDNPIRTNGTYTTRLREAYDDEDLSTLLWTRLTPLYQSMRVIDDEGQVWLASHLNSRFRFCKYAPGDSFGAHFDSRRLASVDCQSFMTVNMYLNTVPDEAGGATRALAASSSSSSSSSLSQEETTTGDHKVLTKMQPMQGSAAVFRDTLFHDGEALKAGVKYLLRTEVMFERETPFDFQRLYGHLGLQERGRMALDYAKRLEDSSNFDDAVLWYRTAFKLWPELERDA